MTVLKFERKNAKEEKQLIQEQQILEQEIIQLSVEELVSFAENIALLSRAQGMLIERKNDDNEADINVKIEKLRKQVESCLHEIVNLR